MHGNEAANMSFARKLFLDCFFARAMTTSNTPSKLATSFATKFRLWNILN